MRILQDVTSFSMPNRSNASASDLSPSSELYSQPLGAVVTSSAAPLPPGARMQGQPPPPPPPQAAQAAQATPVQQGMIQVRPSIELIPSPLTVFDDSVLLRDELLFSIP